MSLFRNAKMSGSAFPELANLFARVELGRERNVSGVLLIPLLARDTPDLEVDLLAEALQSGAAQAREVGDAGLVNEIRVTNQGARRILILDGEELVGAKQNRMANVSVLVAAHSEVTVPVSCIERGRWHATKGRSFESPGRTVPSTLRRTKLEHVTTSVSAGRGYSTDQGRIWDDIDHELVITRVVSTTSSLTDLTTRESSRIESSLGALGPVPAQIGVAAVSDQGISIEVVGSARVFERAWRPILRGILMGASSSEPRTGSASDAVVGAIDRALACQPIFHDAPGIGQTVHARDASLVYGALVHAGSVYHAFVSERT
jgi:hypothetical protein